MFYLLTYILPFVVLNIFVYFVVKDSIKFDEYLRSDMRYG